MSLKSQPRQKHKQTLLIGSSSSCATAICVYRLSEVELKDFEGQEAIQGWCAWLLAT